MSARYEARLGEYEEAVSNVLEGLRDERVVERMWDGDHTVWGPEPEEIANRLGWLHSPENTEDTLPELRALADAAREEGVERVVVLGMGGSSLAPEVFGLALGNRSGYPTLDVLDSTDPEAVLRRSGSLDLSRTLFVVSTKSGGTVETFSFFKYFYNEVAEAVGAERAGSRFVAITDPGSGLADTAEKHDFRKTFLNDPNIGGRYSGLSLFGAVPAALIGVDLPRLLENARGAARECAKAAGEENPGAHLGAAMGELAKNHGRDKLTILASPSLEPFGPWAEQLVAESTGKDGTGILPVVEEPLAGAGAYGDDRFFVSMTLEGEEDDGTRGLLRELRDLGHPVFEITLDGAYDIGGEMFRWEVATAVAGRILGINPFDQPNVESAKIQARKMVAEYRERGELPEPEPTVEEGDMAVYSPSGAGASSVDEALSEFFERVRPGDYVALQAYLPPSEEITDVLEEMRTRLRERFGVATTSGYGPRFLHSTGQLHKGDGGNGVFVQITADNAEDAPIPDEAGGEEASLTFGVLEAAQALGDRQALLDAGRRVVRVHVRQDVAGNLRKLADSLRRG